MLFNQTQEEALIRIVYTIICIIDILGKSIKCNTPVKNGGWNRVAQELYDNCIKSYCNCFGSFVCE